MRRDQLAVAAADEEPVASHEADASRRNARMHRVLHECVGVAGAKRQDDACLALGEQRDVVTLGAMMAGLTGLTGVAGLAGRTGLAALTDVNHGAHFLAAAPTE